MIKTVKRVLPIITFIILAAGAVGLWVQSLRMDVLIGGLSTAVVIGLLFYVVINWDDALEHKKKETRQLADVVNHAMDSVVICDQAGQVLYANAAARKAYLIDDRMTHAEQFEAIGLSKDRMVEVIDNVMSGQPWNGELSVPGNGDGRRLCVGSCRAKPRNIGLRRMVRRVLWAGRRRPYRRLALEKKTRDCISVSPSAADQCVPPRHSWI